MSIAHELLNACDEFFSLIANEEESEELTEAIENLEKLLERNSDGWDSLTPDRLVLAVGDQIEEIWGLISAQEKTANPMLEEYYDAVHTMVEDLDQEFRDECSSDEEDESDFGDEDDCYEEEE